MKFNEKRKERKVHQGHSHHVPSSAGQLGPLQGDQRPGTAAKELRHFGQPGNQQQLRPQEYDPDGREV